MFLELHCIWALAQGKTEPSASAAEANVLPRRVINMAYIDATDAGNLYEPVLACVCPPSEHSTRSAEHPRSGGFCVSVATLAEPEVPAMRFDVFLLCFQMDSHWAWRNHNQADPNGSEVSTGSRQSP